MSLVIRINGTRYNVGSAALHNAIKQLQAELDTARKGNSSGCVHAVGTSVDREGCCTSCGEDLNYLAIMQTKLAKANEEIAFWMSEGDGTEWPPENMEWRKLFDISKEKRTVEQTKKMGELASIVRWKCDEKIQYERAEAFQVKLHESIEDNKLLMELISKASEENKP